MYNLSNVDIKIRKLDDINISNDLDSQTLQYIIDKYFYVNGYSYNENDNLIKVSYDIYNDLYFDLLSDTNLTVNIRKFFVYYILASMTGCINIYILINNEFLDNAIFVFDVRRKNDIMFCRQNCDKKYSDYLQYLDMNKGHYIDYLCFDRIDIKSNYIHGLRRKRTAISGRYYSYTDLSQARVALVENDTLTEGDYDLIREVYDVDNNRYYESKKFIYKLTFDSNVTQVLWIKNIYLMFGLRNQIVDFLTTVKNMFNPNVLDIKICSAVMDDSYNPNVTQSCAGEGKFAEDFWFGTTSGYSYCDGYRTANRYVNNYYMYYVNIMNKEIADYVLEHYYNNDDYINTEHFNTQSYEALNNIKQFYNFYAQQIEYYDLKSEFVDTNIGDINNAYYVDVFGYDSTNMKPIILYISNKVQLDDTHYIYFYKLQSGGIEPINNNYLWKPYDKTVSESSDLIASFIINMYEPPNKMDVLQTYMDVMGLSCNKPLKKSPFYSDIPQLKNNVDVGVQPAEMGEYFIQKHTMYQYAIKADTLIPQEAMADLFTNTPSNCSDFETLINKYFVYNDNEIILDMSYDNIFLRYRKQMEPKYFYYITKNHPYDQYYSNMILINDTVNEIKNLQFLKYVIDTTTRTNLNIVKIGDLTNTLETVDLFEGDIIDDILTKIPSKQDVNMDCTGECNYGQYSLKENEILSDFFKEKIVEFDRTAYDTNDLYLIFYKWKDILTKSPNKFIVANKVIGSDWLMQYGFKSSHTDLSFNNLFLTSILSFDGLFFIYDVYNNKLYSIKFNDVNLEFVPNSTRPLKFNPNIMYDIKMYKFNRSDFDLVLNILNEYNFFQTINNIKFAFKPYDEVSDTIFYPFCNDFVLIGDI